ncbi:MAG: hypothetical protein ACRDB0_02065 [Paraclostridium sp.]
MTKIKCDLALCKYNSTCCIDPYEGKGFCTKDDIRITFDEESSSVDCADYAMSLVKHTECVKCQIKKYGSIGMGVQQPIFEVTETDDDLF